MREEAKIIELAVVKNGFETRGRPVILTPRRFIRICHWIEQGQSAVDACRAEGVTYAILRKRVGQYPSWARRMKEAEEIREHFLREYHIANISKHSVKNVAASMFWLERRYPNEFALRSVMRDTSQHDPIVFDKISLAQLIENARLAKEIADSAPPGLSLPPPENSVAVSN